MLVGDVAYGQVIGAFTVGSWALGLVGFPAVLLATQWVRARLDPRRLRVTGPVAHGANVAAFFALWLTWWYAPALSVVSDATLIFYGSSMLLAAARGYGGCEVLAVSNWLLRRNDQVGCLVFAPIDHVEVRGRRVVGVGLVALVAGVVLAVSFLT